VSEIDRVEVVRGATSNLYGSLAMAGVIQYLTVSTDQKRLFAQADGGNLHSYHGSLVAAGPLAGDFSGKIYGDFFRTDGYQTVLNRGPVDVPSAFESKNGGLKLMWKPSSRVSGFVTGNYYLENRTAGLKKAANEWWFGDGAVGVDYETGGGSHWVFRAFGGTEFFSNNNSRVTPGLPFRVTETRILHQDIPVDHVGGSIVWWRRFGDKHALTIGADSRFITAVNKERVWTNLGVFDGTRRALGHQELAGLFGEWVYTPVTPLTITMGLRYDHWWNFNAESACDSLGSVCPNSRPATPTTSFTRFQDQHEGAINPRLGAVYRVTPEFKLRTAGYTGFRAPLLNELYRGFNAGNIRFEGNPALGPERVYGGEVGADWVPGKQLRFGVTGFYNHIVDLIQFVTVDPTLNVRQNVGKARSHGVEFESEYRPFSTLTLGASYALTIAEITENKENKDLEGLWLANIPRHQGAVFVRWADPEWLDFTLRVRIEGAQFANDLNTFSLPGYTTLDLFAAREIIKHVQAFVSVTNLLAQRVTTGKNTFGFGTTATTLTNIGAPRIIWGGLKVRF
jgi:outer membrane receptor protein involved in Fe transport